MPRKSLLLIDLKTNENTQWPTLFEETIKKLSNKEIKDSMLNNYQNLDKNWQNYEAFCLLVDGNSILGFSGMHSAPYPENTSRLLSRLYYTKELRTSDLGGHTLPSYAAQLMLPYQVKKAQEMGKDLVFLSFQEMRRRRFCFKIAEALRLTYQQDWFVYDKMVNTARRLPNGELNMDRSVWQNAVVLKLNSLADLDLPQISIDKWNLLFTHSQK